MPRKSLIRTSEYPYHVMARTNNRDQFAVSGKISWEIFCEKIQIVSERYDANTISFVLMPNHFHMIIQTPNENLDTIMNYLLREVSRSMGTISGRINHTFGGPYKWCLIDRDSYLMNAYKYVYRNPVAANLVEAVEDYPFSTLQNLLSKRQKRFPIDANYAIDKSLIPNEIEDQVQWLNTPFRSTEITRIRKALRRRIFVYPKYLLPSKCT